MREFALLMGGRVDVESEPGQGARFIVRIPPRKEPLASADLDAYDRARGLDPFAHLGVAAKVDEAPPPTGKPRIVVAEDNPDMRLYVGELLHKQYDVVGVANGREALA